jgi:hypothetical protein
MKRIRQIVVKSAMQSRMAPALLLVALGLGAAVGYIAGRRSTPAHTPVASSPKTENADKTRVHSAQNAAAGTPFNAGDFESRLRKVSSGPMRKRWDNLRDLAKSVAPGDEIS